MNLRKLKRRARFIAFACLLVIVGGQFAFSGEGFNRQAARAICDTAIIPIFWWLGVEHLNHRKRRRMLKQAEARAIAKALAEGTMELPLFKMRPFWAAPRERRKAGTIMPGGPSTVDEYRPDSAIDSDVEGGFTNPDYDDGFILWEGPTYPKPRGGKLTDLNGVESDKEQLTVATFDATKANNYAFSQPSNASARAIAQTARLKDKYE